MASSRARERYLTINEEDLAAILGDSSSANSTHSVNYAVTILNALGSTKNLSLEKAGKVGLNIILKNVYASTRTQRHEMYSKKSELSICYGIQKHSERTRKFDIINDSDFKEAHTGFAAALVKIRKEGKREIQHKTPLSKEDLQLLYSSSDLDTKTKCNRERENVRDLKPSDFLVNENDNVTEMKDRATKSHKGVIQDSQKSQGGQKTICYAPFHLSWSTCLFWIPLVKPFSSALNRKIRSKTTSGMTTVLWIKTP